MAHGRCLTHITCRLSFGALVVMKLEPDSGLPARLSGCFLSMCRRAQVGRATAFSMSFACSPRVSSVRFPALLSQDIPGTVDMPTRFTSSVFTPDNVSYR